MSFSGIDLGGEDQLLELLDSLGVLRRGWVQGGGEDEDYEDQLHVRNCQELEPELQMYQSSIGFLLWECFSKSHLVMNLIAIQDN